MEEVCEWNHPCCLALSLRMTELDPERIPLPDASPAELEALGAQGPALTSPELVRITKPKPYPPWSGLDLVVVIGFALVAWVTFSSIALGLARLVTHKQVPVRVLVDNPLVALGAQSATELVVVVFVIAWIGRLSPQSFWKIIHWNWRTSRVPGLLLAGVVLALVADYVSRFLPIPKSLPVEKFFSDTAAAYLMSVLGVLLAPLFEELLFRGLFYPLVRRTTGVTVATLLTATLFAFIHGGQLGFAWAPLLSIFIVGLVFTIVRERAESVAASYLMHCGYNFALFASLWIASDHFRHLEKVLD
jgi:membrane protease YdiL (CAAX protease family)